MSRRKKAGRNQSSRYSRMSQNSSKTAEQKMPAIKAIVDGDYDDLPEQAFYMVGGIEEAIEKAKTTK